MSAREVLVLTLVSAFSAFPSPFYADIAAASAWGLWTSAVLFAAHGVAVIVAMTWLRRAGMARRVPSRSLVVVALLVDAVGGVLLALGMSAAGVGLLLAGRVVTGLALGLATPLLTETLARHARGTAWATAATLGGVGMGALAAAMLVATGVAVPAVFAAGASVLALVALAVALSPTMVPAIVPTTAAPPSASARDRALAAAVVLVFVANGLLGLFTSLVPAVVVAAIGGGSLLAGAVVAATMIGAGAARLAMDASRPRVVASVAVGSLGAGCFLFTAGVAAHQGPAVILGSVILGASCGLGYDAGLRMAIGSKVDALARVAALARAQRAGQLGLVVPALVFPALARA
ncbi:hypothetical protein [Demequina sp. NBRC 110054]|uniref:hypothetical protein n=1 Tax=Demequina sp. NBRC 110054 TaxID=1570343 RepID=UPI000A06B513|nr:hypothetical protein [Demequina sp. NBRC 110054]